jgi:hypothetical protein
VVQSAVKEGSVRKISGGVVFVGLSEEGEGMERHSEPVPERRDEGAVCGLSAARGQREKSNA